MLLRSSELSYISSSISQNLISNFTLAISMKPRSRHLGLSHIALIYRHCTLSILILIEQLNPIHTTTNSFSRPWRRFLSTTHSLTDPDEWIPLLPLLRTGLLLLYVLNDWAELLLIDFQFQIRLWLRLLGTWLCLLIGCLWLNLNVLVLFFYVLVHPGSWGGWLF